MRQLSRYRRSAYGRSGTIRHRSKAREPLGLPLPGLPIRPSATSSLYRSSIRFRFAGSPAPKKSKKPSSIGVERSGRDSVNTNVCACVFQGSRFGQGRGSGDQIREGYRCDFIESTVDASEVVDRLFEQAFEFFSHRVPQSRPSLLHAQTPAVLRAIPELVARQ
jgi:hypothetical protein